MLDDGATLPEGTRVRIEVAPSEDELAELRRGLLSLSGIVKGMPPDFARNHDHYIHGTPKK